MNDNSYLFFPIGGVIILIFFLGALMGDSTGNKRGRKEGIIYCMEQPEKCKIEFQYLKLTEKQNER